jgi:uncharacterized protein
MARKVVVTGANGWIGSKLSALLTVRGWLVTGVSRTPDSARARSPGIDWIAPDGALDEAVEEAGVVVNLAGRHLLERPWDDAFKEALYESRIDLTRRIVAALGRSTVHDRVLVSASGYPVYGDCGDRPLSEDEPVSRASFLYLLDADWEDAALTARFSARVAVMRIGLVFGGDGGALPVLKQPFDGGTGLVLGSGEQWVPWVHIDDAVGLLLTALEDSRYQGPVNVVAPEEVRYATFARQLADVLNVPCEVQVPAEGVYDQMGPAGELVLMSTRLVPARGRANGFAFRHPELRSALEALFGSANVEPAV